MKKAVFDLEPPRGDGLREVTLTITLSAGEVFAEKEASFWLWQMPGETPSQAIEGLCKVFRLLGCDVEVKNV